MAECLERPPCGPYVESGHVNLNWAASRTGRCTPGRSRRAARRPQDRDPEHRLAGTSLQSLSEVGVPRIQPPPENDVAHEEQYGREDEDCVVEDQQRQPPRHREVGSREKRDRAEIRHRRRQLHCRHRHAEEGQCGICSSRPVRLAAPTWLSLAPGSRRAAWRAR